jgi:methionine-S-sulfoxide reductase
MSSMRTLAFAAILALGSALLLARVPVVAQSQSQAPSSPPGSEVATFAGGCFWCVESDFDKVEGVLSTVSGFMGGRTENPTYQEVSHGNTGHLEVVNVTFDPKKVSYKTLVEYFWRHVDPYDAGGQFCDRGESYKTAIFAHTPEQKRIAEASKADLQKNGPLKDPVATAIRDASAFTAAEEYHQDYYKKNPFRYKWYRTGCRRDARIEQIWGKAASH